MTINYYNLSSSKKKIFEIVEDDIGHLFENFEYFHSEGPDVKIKCIPLLDEVRQYVIDIMGMAYNKTEENIDYLVYHDGCNHNYNIHLMYLDKETYNKMKDEEIKSFDFLKFLKKFADDCGYYLSVQKNIVKLYLKISIDYSTYYYYLTKKINTIFKILDLSVLDNFQEVMQDPDKFVSWYEKSKFCRRWIFTNQESLFEEKVHAQLINSKKEICSSFFHSHIYFENNQVLGDLSHEISIFGNDIKDNLNNFCKKIDNLDSNFDFISKLEYTKKTTNLIISDVCSRFGQKSKVAEIKKYILKRYPKEDKEVEEQNNYVMESEYD